MLPREVLREGYESWSYPSLFTLEESPIEINEKLRKEELFISTLVPSLEKIIKIRGYYIVIILIIATLQSLRVRE
ncbi:MAG TPA: hypothetical protein VMX55_03650 [candidate division Zixibacteria bacterium]|nr:hypothetical protein [candidate division Zixibacteria bacterium]